MESLIEQRIAELSPEYRSFFESDFIEVFSQTFGETLNFDQNTIELLENGLFLHLLFLLNETEVISFISSNCQIGHSSALEVYSAFKQSLPSDIRSLITMTNTVAEMDFNEIPLSTIEEEIVETEQKISTVQGVHTMAQDMRAAQTQTEPVYQSSQSEILSRPQTSVPPPPAPPQRSGPRWDTEE